MAPLPEGLNYNYSRNELFGDLTLISGKNFQNIIIYNIAQNNYKDIPHLLLSNNINKCMLRGNNRIYLFERGGRIFESDENNISNWAEIGGNTLPNGNCNHQSVVIRYKGSLYFIEPDSKLWKFDLSSKQASEVKVI